VWSAFVFRIAVNPCLEAPSETSCFARSGKQTSLHFMVCGTRWMRVIAESLDSHGEEGRRQRRGAGQRVAARRLGAAAPRGPVYRQAWSPGSVRLTSFIRTQSARNDL
jgi:hypothetical protein